ncbi:cyclic lactone autoinducer peptide [Selenihalanaerobacter shriftii]|uniref:Cyclic lactone autoinducer peptide n=1 Tax=Selenihalanaerobacter shriftii TaxID=142842 RepID=A0A1T4Q8B1_9FIRM|nr:cyclic lactone autoinducer peptide [Selenihalanaerobacter shriftii]SKA00040.1 cyclic lactone autoinducer peptide [Selenihalanaerobacter shriftii]
MKKVIAKVLKKSGKANVASASGFTFYQPKVPKILKNDKK